MRVVNTDRSELMDVRKLSRDGNDLVIEGTIMQSMPIRCVLTPTEFRKAFGLLSWRLFFFLLTLPFRS